MSGAIAHHPQPFFAHINPPSAVSEAVSVILSWANVFMGYSSM